MSSCRLADGRPKVRYDTRADAKRARADLNARFPDGEKLHIYRCDVCRFFHLGRPSNGTNRDRLKHRQHAKHHHRWKGWAQ